MTPLLPTYLSILLLIGIFTAQIFTPIGETNPKANAVFFIALVLVLALINLLLGTLAAWIALGTGTAFWLVGLLIGIFTTAAEVVALPRCASASVKKPACKPRAPPCKPACTPQCMECGPYDSEIECVDIRCDGAV